MRSLRIPSGVWDWRGTGLVLVVLLAPLVTAATLTPGSDPVAAVVGGRSLFVGTATLAAGVFLYLHWRLTGSDTTGWMALLLAVAAIPGLALGGFALTHPDVSDSQRTWLVVFRVALVGGLLVALVLSPRFPLRVDPLGTGLLVGLGVACARQLVLAQAEPLPAPPVLELLPALVVAALTVVIALRVSRLDLPRWARTRVGAGLVLFGVGSVAGDVPALVTAVVGAALLAATAVAVLHAAIEAEKEQLAELNDRLHRAESGRREDRARLHEIDATVAGIASAQRLMHDGLAADRTDALTRMVHAEVERLQRLLAARGPAQRREVDLDEVVGQIVAAHRARGRAVSWEPSGVRAVGRADDIAEIVNVLLENAAVHGGPGPATVRVETDTVGAGVRVTVADQGPGVPAELRDRVFDWGLSRPGSPGQGIGLHVAGELAHELGGRLELLHTLRGAAFALDLPAAPREVAARGHVARAS